MAAHNPTRQEKREHERWLNEHIGNHDTVVKWDRAAAFVIRRETRIARESGYAGVYFQEVGLTRAIASKNDQGFCEIGTIYHDPRPGIDTSPVCGWVVYYNFKSGAMTTRRLGSD